MRQLGLDFPLIYYEGDLGGLRAFSDNLLSDRTSQQIAHLEVFLLHPHFACAVLPVVCLLPFSLPLSTGCS